MSDSTDRLYVEYPLKPGPQGCFIERQPKMGGVLFRIGVIVLPVTVPHGSKISAPVAAAGLAIANHTFAEIISKYRKSAAFMDLVPATTHQPPYRSTSDQALRKRLDGVIEELRRHGNADNLADLVGDALVETTTHLSFWEPWWLAEATEPRSDNDLIKRWRIVCHWHRWSVGKMTIEEFWRLVNKGDKEPLYGAQEAYRNLKRRCASMGLVVPGE